MTKEEVREIMSYCEEQKVSYKIIFQELLSFFRATGQESTQIRHKGSNLELFGTKKIYLEPNWSYFGKIDHKLHT